MLNISRRVSEEPLYHLYYHELQIIEDKLSEVPVSDMMMLHRGVLTSTE